MIVTRTPVRIPLGGGGTDLPSYYERYGGFLVSAAIDKYIYITVNKRFEESIRVSYSVTEIVDEVEEIEHPIVREVLKLVGVDRGIEITSIADVPANTGLGTSSCFTVGLLNALHAYKREQRSPEEIAEEACHIEIDLLGEPIGKQDQYAGSIGGVPCLDIARDGRVAVERVELSNHALDLLESNTLLFYTGIRRRASEILAEQDEKGRRDEAAVVENLHAIKEIGREVRSALDEGDLARFGHLLDLHWRTKKGLSEKISTGEVDRWYELAMENGASGGKLMGAGGGGFLMFYCDNGKDKLRSALAGEGLAEMRYRIDHDGSKLLVNI